MYLNFDCLLQTYWLHTYWLIHGVQVALSRHDDDCLLQTHWLIHGTQGRQGALSRHPRACLMSRLLLQLLLHVLQAPEFRLHIAWARKVRTGIFQVLGTRLFSPNIWVCWCKTSTFQKSWYCRFIHKWVCRRRTVCAPSVYFNALKHIAVCCSVLQYVAVCCSMLQYVAVCCSMLQYVAVCCSLSIIVTRLPPSVYKSCLANILFDVAFITS